MERLLTLLVVVMTVVTMTTALTGPNIPPGENHPDFWNGMARDRIKQRMRQKENDNVAKNVILFIGDGLGPTTVTAARILRGQLNDMPGEESVLAFEEFPHVALSKTYNIDRQTPDSAGTATAILSGVKTNWFLIGLDGRATAGDCLSVAGHEVDTMLDWAKDAGRRTGVVTTARITHATPAAAYAHSADRYWEGDIDTKDVEGGCRDIAQQLIDDNKDINVLLGGGRRYMLPNTTRDPETNTIDKNQRQDGRHLIEEWKADKEKRKLRSKYVWNKGQFDDVDPKYTDYLLGLFESNHMQYELDRDNTDAGEPSLAEMTEKAIGILDNPLGVGYFLMVEGARIDHAHHDNLAKKALHETLAMDDAVMKAVGMTDPDDTLIIVTGDHSHVFDIAGYAYRGTDIFGLVEPVYEYGQTLDGKPYSVLYYGNGPAYNEPRLNLSQVDMHDKDFAVPSGVHTPWETHGGEDVAIYAQGPMAHLFHGVQEQNYIGHVMAYAACIGPYHGDCHHPNRPDAAMARALYCPYFLIISLAVIIIQDYQ